MNPIKAFLFDLIEGAIYGAAVALLALPDGFADGKAALFIVAGGAVGGVKAAARVALAKFVAGRKASG